MSSVTLPKETLLENAMKAIRDAKNAVVELHIVAESLSVKTDEAARREAMQHAALAQGLLTGALKDLERVKK